MLQKIQAFDKTPPSLPQTHGATLAGVQAPALLQTAALCAHLGMNSSTLWRWIRERNFPKPIEVGSKTRMWRTAEVDAWLNSQATAAHTARQSVTGAGHE
ncbi:MAG: AlpA family phage regulatory protein [Burkholderiales bacterium]|jgi:prophage regulatory protein|uniref:helix-turn-helix transcriptional regulator n=1 Tax=Limnobacter sp. TaxID=2003368 RepID=UPI0039BD1670|nr:AlpA family phage regulatory protein [Burkholderiales bacterium]